MADRRFGIDYKPRPCDERLPCIRLLLLDGQEFAIELSLHS